MIEVDVKQKRFLALNGQAELIATTFYFRTAYVITIFV
jgi:hypothetical protein